MHEKPREQAPSTIPAIKRPRMDHIGAVWFGSMQICVVCVWSFGIIGGVIPSEFSERDEEAERVVEQLPYSVRVPSDDD